jgi:outer membrane lipoprotein-sorting protein
MSVLGSGRPSGRARRTVVSVSETSTASSRPRRQLLGGRRRWAVPVVAAGLIAAAAAVGSSSADARVDLPPRTPAQVLALAAGSQVQAFSGTVAVHADLGLPQLPDLGQGSDQRGGAGSPAALLTGLLAGDSTLRVWADGPTRERVQLLRRYAQTDLARDGREVWTYTSATDTFAHATLPDRPDKALSGTASPMEQLTPQALADQVLAAAGPTTEVTAGQGLRVAGRDAYTLRLAPRSADSLVGLVSLAVDARTGAVLRLSVTARGHSEPALTVGFTSIDFSRPDPSRFTLTPPPGATVRTLRVPAATSSTSQRPTAPGGVGEGARAQGPRTIGQGWTSVLEVPAAGDPAALTQALARSGLARATVAVPGGRLLRTDLLTVLIKDDGRVYAGAVTPEALARVAR